ncbi:MAG TPA: DNA-formamidopyrimidine glycosylase family protein [Bacteroidia bacterium]|nr:DNA-formamidopyrimidine glycosylase family protein [Bacteroidia bacterium]
MPELPDLEVYSENLTKTCKGKTVDTVRIHKEGWHKGAGAKLEETLPGEKLQVVEREGKELRFRFSGGHVMGLHLMLKGRIAYYNPKKPAKPNIAEIMFTDNTGLLVSDFLGAANVSYNPETSKVPDALSEDFDVDYFKPVLQKEKKTPIKSVLLDQKIVRGIGNAYADEILYDCGISPFAQSAAIPDAKIKELIKSSKNVLKDAIKQIKKADPDIIAGEVRDFLLVHIPKKTETEKGEKILVKEINKRKSYYTESQEMYPNDLFS